MSESKSTPMQLPAAPGVYFVRGNDLAEVKIGYTLGLHNRMRDMRMHHSRLTVLGFWEDAGKDEERILHNRFRRYRVAGEWFTLSPEIQEFIDSLPRIVGEATTWSNKMPIEVSQNNGGGKGRGTEVAPPGYATPTEAAEILGCSKDAVRDQIRKGTLAGKRTNHPVTGEARYYVPRHALEAEPKPASVASSDAIHQTQVQILQELRRCADLLEQLVKRRDKN